PGLESRGIYYWQVRVADNHGHLSDWSQPGHWGMGVRQAPDWKAKWITPNLDEDETKSNPAPLLRREFSFDKKVERARLYATAMGLYEMSLNGERVGDEYFTPGWTAYDFRYQYQTYDVTGSLKNGTNCLAAMLGDGWFRGRLAWDDKRNSYGKKLALLAQLVVTYKDGTQQIVGSDDGWKSATGAVLESDIYNGETYDARLEQPGWNEAGFDDKNWKSVTVLPTPKAKLVAPAGPPVKAMEQITPVKVLKTPGGDTVLDMGQNMVGWIRFRLTAPAGTTITWGQKGNCPDVPQYCPQRDERLGWTRDAQLFTRTASFNHDTAAFYTKWLKDVALDQEDDGAVPFVIPNVLSHETRKGAAASAGWADVAVIVPWVVYQSYGDKRILEEHYPSMKAWVEYMRRQAGEKSIWNNGFSFGDWLAF